MQKIYQPKLDDWVRYHGTVTTVDGILNDSEVTLSIHDELQPTPIKVEDIKLWEPEQNEICIFFDYFSEFCNMHYVISPYGGTDDKTGYHLANSNRVYYDNIRPLEFAATMNAENFKTNK